MKILVVDGVEAICGEKLRAGGHTVEEYAALEPAELLVKVKDANGLVVRGKSKITAEVVAAAPELRVVVRAGSGLDTIDVPAAQAKGVEVRNVPGGNSVSVAELVFGLLLSLTRYLPDATAASRAGTAKRGKPMGNEVAGRTLGIVGYGRIGRELARRALAFDMKVIASDPLLTPEEAARDGIVRAGSVDELIPQAHVISLHVPNLPTTRHMFGARQFAAMQPGTIFLNAARAELVDHEALLAALTDGRVAGAGLDVVDEASPAAAAIKAHARVYLTPHLGASTVEAQARVAAAAGDIMVEAMNRVVHSAAK